MRDAVCQNEVTGPEHGVVTHGLRQHMAVDRDLRRLALTQHKRLRAVIHDDDIGPLRRTVQRDGILLYDTVPGGSAPRFEIGDQMAPHPLFGREYQPHRPQVVPYKRPSVAPKGPQPYRRKIQFGV